MKKAHNKKKQNVESKQRKTKYEVILEKKNTKNTRKNDTTSNKESWYEMLEVTALPYNLRGTEEVSLYTKPSDALKKIQTEKWLLPQQPWGYLDLDRGEKVAYGLKASNDDDLDEF